MYNFLDIPPPGNPPTTAMGGSWTHLVMVTTNIVRAPQCLFILCVGFVQEGWGERGGSMGVCGCVGLWGMGLWGMGVRVWGRGVWE